MNAFGIVLGVLALIAAFIAPLMGGWIGGAATIVLAVGALVLGVLSRKKSENKKGMGGIVLGVIAAVLAVVMIVSTSSMMKTMKDKLLDELDKQGSKFPTVAKYAEQADTDTGFIGFINSMAGKVSEEDKAKFEEEAKDLANLLTESSDSSSSK